MNAQGNQEDGMLDRDRKRNADKLVEQINEDRRKKGMKTKTKQELIGDSWRR